MCIWVRSRNCSCLVTWFCYQLIAKPGNKTAAVSWPDPYAFVAYIASVSPTDSIHWRLRDAMILTLLSQVTPQNAIAMIPMPKLASWQHSVFTAKNLLNKTLWYVITFQYHHLSQHWTLIVIIMPTFLPRVTAQVVITTTCGDTTDDKFGIMTMFSFQWN